MCNGALAGKLFAHFIPSHSSEPKAFQPTALTAVGIAALASPWVTAKTDGEIAPVHRAAQPIKDAQGRIQMIVDFDFDPKEAPFESVITLANTLKRICDKAGLPTFPKTSGSSGLHVMIPLGGQVENSFAVQLAELLASMIVATHPEIATVERVVARRGRRVYLDCYQNGNNKLIAAPFCVRAKPGAPVSMPLVWAEVKKGLTPNKFTIRNAIERLEKRGDPMAPLLTLKPALKDALGRLLS